MRVNMTKGNFEKIWKSLDQAEKKVNNAQDMINRMTDTPKYLKDKSEAIDVEPIDTLKKEIESMMNKI